MPQRIVYDFETIKIDEKNRTFAAVTAGRLNGEIQELVEHCAVGQAGQCIMGRKVLNLLVSLSLFCVSIKVFERK